MSLKLCSGGHPEEGKPCSQVKRAGGRGSLETSVKGPQTSISRLYKKTPWREARHQKTASFSALQRNIRGEAKRTFRQWGGFLRSRIIPDQLLVEEGVRVTTPRYPPPSLPLTSDPFSTPSLSPPSPPQWDRNMTPTGGEGGQPRGRGDTWASREPAESQQLKERA